MAPKRIVRTVRDSYPAVRHVPYRLHKIFNDSWSGNIRLVA
jgi:hypothetical protein